MSKDISKPEQLITEHVDIWTSAILAKSTSGRGSSKKYELYGIKKLRKLILELAIRGKLVPQDANDEPASVLLEKIAIERAQLIKEGKIREAKPVAKIKREEDFLELPNNWELCRFGAITFNRDPERVPLSVEVRRNRQGSYDYYGASGVIDKIDDYLFEKPLLLIGEDGANLINRSTPIAFIARGQYWVNNHAHVIDGINEDFLLYLCIHINAISLEAYITGSAQPKMNQAKMNSILIALPPLEEQKRIIAKVDELMLLCDQLEQRTEASIDAHVTLVEVLLATLTDSADADELTQNWARIAEHFDSLFTTEQSIEVLKQTVLQLAVMGKLVPQNPDDESASVLLERINEVKSKLVKEEGLRTSASKELNADDKYLTQPHGWEWMRLGNLAKFIDYRGKTPTKIESGVRLITAKNIRYGYVDLKPEEFISEDEYTSWMTRGFPKQGDTLFTPEAPLGNAANIDIKGKFALAQRAICFQWHLSGISDFLLLQILAKPFQLQLIDNATGMTATGIKASKLKEIPMIIPPLAEQQRIVTKVDELMAICDQLKEKIRQSQETQVKLTDALIDRALG